MANKNVVTAVKEIAKPIIESLGYEIDDMEYAKTAEGMVLTIYLYSDNGIKIEDCEKVARAMNEPLEELDPTKGESYTFNVSSPGINRPLKTEKQMTRNLNKKIEVKLYSKQDGKKLFVGEFLNFTENDITVNTGKETKIFNLKDVAQIVPHIEF